MQEIYHTKIVARGKKRVGQGHGSGRGKTAGRGTKGQKARRDIPLKFEGGALPLIKRLPFLRGKDKNKSFRAKPFILDVSVLAAFPKDATIDVKALVEKKLVSEQALQDGVKILGNGDIAQAVKVNVPVSKSAAAKIEKAGGTTASA